MKRALVIILVMCIILFSPHERSYCVSWFWFLVANVAIDATKVNFAMRLLTSADHHHFFVAVTLVSLRVVGSQRNQQFDGNFTDTPETEFEDDNNNC